MLNFISMWTLGGVWEEALLIYNDFGNWKCFNCVTLELLLLFLVSFFDWVNDLSVES